MRLTLFIATFFIASGAIAQDNNITGKPALFAIALSVKNTNVTQQWYIDKLHCTILKNADSVAPGIKFGLLQGEGYVIELIENNKSIATDLQQPENKGPLKGIFKFGLLVNNLEKKMAELKSKNVTILNGPFDDNYTKTRSFIISDPDGNLIQFFEKMK